MPVAAALLISPIAIRVPGVQCCGGGNNISVICQVEKTCGSYEYMTRTALA